MQLYRKNSWEPGKIACWFQFRVDWTKRRSKVAQISHIRVSKNVFLKIQKKHKWNGLPKKFKVANVGLLAKICVLKKSEFCPKLLLKIMILINRKTHKDNWVLEIINSLLFIIYNEISSIFSFLNTQYDWKCYVSLFWLIQL